MQARSRFDHRSSAVRSAETATGTAILGSGIRTGRKYTLAFLLLFGLWSAFAPRYAAAQEPAHGVVAGTVRTVEGGTPLGGVTVELTPSGRSTLSDESGAFRFIRVPAGVHTLRLHVIGRSVLEQTIEVRAGEVVRPELALGATPVELDPLLVLQGRTSLAEGVDRSRVPGAVHIVGAQAIQERPVVFSDIHALLREVPGVNIQEEEGFGLRPNIGFRGTGVERSSKITLMEDGVLIAPAPYAAPAAYYFPVAGRMSSIEVRKGSSQIRYGPSTIGGALNLVSSPIPSRFSVFLDASGGEDDARVLEARVGDSSEHFGWMLETHQSQSDGFKELDLGGNTGFDIEDYIGKFRVNTSRDAETYQELELKLGYYDQRSDETYLGLTESDFARTPLRRYAASQEDVMRADHQQIQLRHFVRFPAGLDVTTTAYHNEFARNWYKLQSVSGRGISSVLADPSAYQAELALLRGATDGTDELAVRANNREYFSRGIQTTVGWSFEALGRHALELGARFHEDEEDRFQHEDLFSIDDGLMTLTTPGAQGSQSNRVGSAEAWAFHLMDRIELGRLTLAPGLRYETVDFERVDYADHDPERLSPTRVRKNTMSSWIPGIGALLDVRPALQVFAGVHKGFGPGGPGADEATDPESSVNYELGVRSLTAGSSFEVTGFFSDYDNILGRATLAVSEEGDDRIFNGGDVHALGLEVALGRDLDLGGSGGLRVPLRATYTLTRATFRTAFESDFEPWGDVEKGDHLPYLPTHQFFGSAGLEWGPWGGRLTAAGTSEMRTVAGQGDVTEGTDGYLVLGLGFDYEASTGVTAYANVQNLADNEYIVARRPAGLRPGLARTLQIGVRLNR